MEVSVDKPEEPWDGVTDRRSFIKCAWHDEMFTAQAKDFAAGKARMDRFEDKIDALLRGQAAQAVSIQDLHATVNNGLKDKLNRTVTCVEEMKIEFKRVCIIYDEKFSEFDDFKWFRDWANGFKDHAISTTLTVITLGGFVSGMLILFWYYMIRSK